MPTFGDITQFLGRQLFGRTALPQADLSSKTIIVTGSNCGLGFECAKHLARLNVSLLILGVRNISKGEEARTRILQETRCERHTTIEVWQIDQSNYQSVLAFGDRVRTKLPRLDGLVANAGVQLPNFELAEGLEHTLTVNVVSTFLLALAVLPKLRDTCKEYATDTRLSFVGSCIHVFAPEAQLEHPDGKSILESLSIPESVDMDNRYFISKLLEHQCFNELATRVSPGAETGKDQKHEVIVTVVNPGWCTSEIDRHQKPWSGMQKVLFALMGRTAEEGSRTLVHGITADRLLHAEYLSECKSTPQSAFVRSARGREIQRRLWDDLMDHITRISPEVAGFI